MKSVVIILLAFSCVTSGIGCAKAKKSAAVPAPAATPPPGTAPPPPRGDGDTGTTNEGNEAELKIEGGTQLQRNQRLGELFFNDPINSPVNIRVGVSLAPQGSGYGGEVWIKFEDGGRTREASLSTYHPYSNASDTSKNIWFQFNGKTVFHGFFQDAYGAIVLVVDNAVSLGDGTPAELVGGEIWFQNFGDAWYPQGPNKMCWQIRNGDADTVPYDCRTFMNGGDVHTTQALYPDTHGEGRPAYKRLGKFSGLLRSAAFGD